MTEGMSLVDQEIHAATHRWSGIALLLIALLAVAPISETMRATLHVSPRDTLLALGSIALMMGVAGAAFRSERVSWFWRRTVDLFETITGQAAILYLIYVSGDVVSFFWILHFAHVFFISASPNPRRLNVAIVGVGTSALALTFFLQGDAGSAIFCLWASGCGMVELSALNGMGRRLSGLLSRLEQTERALAKAKLEGERRRIARDLHDGVGSALAALIWQTRQLDLELPGTLPQERVTGLVEHAHRSLAELRSVVWAMRAPARPWREAAERLRGDLAQSCANRVRLEFSATRGGGEVPGDVCLHLERFVQEAARNALEHARPSRLRVELTFGPVLRASVEDDGVGLPPGAVDRSEGGLRNLRQRVESIGGELSIEAGSRGTRLSASFPLLRADGALLESQAA